MLPFSIAELNNAFEKQHLLGLTRARTHARRNLSTGAAIKRKNRRSRRRRIPLLKGAVSRIEEG